VDGCQEDQISAGDGQALQRDQRDLPVVLFRFR
jgi:hypothetical protein